MSKGCVCSGNGCKVGLGATIRSFTLETSLYAYFVEWYFNFCVLKSSYKVLSVSCKLFSRRNIVLHNLL